jgi:hypothetical protein
VSRLRDLLNDAEFIAIASELERDARRLGFKPVDAFLASPVAKHNKLRRNRCLSRKGHAKGEVVTEVVPGFGPRKYRIKLTPSDPLPIHSRIQRLVWDDTKLPPINEICTCKWSEARPCKRCR